MKSIVLKYILLGKIKLKKREMYSKAKHYGFTNVRVVTCSQELDTLLNKFQDMNDSDYHIAL